MISKDEIKNKYPIHDLLEGWFFRYSEVSNNHYKVEGIDIQKRSVSCEGYDIDSLLKQAVGMAIGKGSN